MRWEGFRRVHKQVCKRIQRRMHALALEGVDAYRAYLEENADEWYRLDEMCRVVVSRFYRDRKVFDTLHGEVLPRRIALLRASGETRLRVWSIGCASGEEAYSVLLCWEFLPPAQRQGIDLELLATDSDEYLLRRARRACYPPGTVKNLPPAWRESAFAAEGGEFCLAPRFRERVRFRRHDVRDEFVHGRFHIVLCRNLVFTYYIEDRQMAALEKIGDALHPNGVLIIGAREQLPPGQTMFVAAEGCRGIYYKNSES